MRRFVVKSFGLDDYLVIVALVRPQSPSIRL
jgi:hypothetical protein